MDIQGGLPNTVPPRILLLCAFPAPDLPHDRSNMFRRSCWKSKRPTRCRGLEQQAGKRNTAGR